MRVQPLAHRLRRNGALLRLVKLLLLERRTLIFGESPGSVSDAIVALLALVPGCLEKLCGAVATESVPTTSSKSAANEDASNSVSNDNNSSATNVSSTAWQQISRTDLVRVQQQLNLPLNLFDEESRILQPHVTLQQALELTAKPCYLAGTTSALLARTDHSPLKLDAVVTLAHHESFHGERPDFANSTPHAAQNLDDAVVSIAHAFSKLCCVYCVQNNILC